MGGKPYFDHKPINRVNLNSDLRYFSGSFTENNKLALSVVIYAIVVSKLIDDLLEI